MKSYVFSQEIFEIVENLKVTHTNEQAFEHIIYEIGNILERKGVDCLKELSEFKDLTVKAKEKAA